eukprot:3099304-Prorocentrum_lima.AAC.1
MPLGSGSSMTVDQREKRKETPQGGPIKKQDTKPLDSQDTLVDGAGSFASLGSQMGEVLRLLQQ